MRVIILDTETATLPLVKEYAKSEKELKLLNIAKPLIYDIGWTIFDEDEHKIIKKRSYLVNEIFFTPLIFSTAYYRDKRPLYMEKLEKKEIIPMNWEEIVSVLLEDLSDVDRVIAYNAMFDFKKAISFTEEYFSKLKTEEYQDWEDKQRRSCRFILSKNKKSKKSEKEFDPLNFNIRGETVLIKDLWGLSCRHLINKDDYKKYCLKKGLISDSGLFFKTTAETTYRYIKESWGFEEAHMALEDAEIETKIYEALLKTGEKLEDGIIYFPFVELGDTCSFIKTQKKKIGVNNVKDKMFSKMQEYKFSSPFSIRLEKKFLELNCEDDIINTIIKERILKRRLAAILKQLTDEDSKSFVFYKLSREAEAVIEKLDSLEEKKKTAKKLHIFYHKEDFDGEMSGAVVDFFEDPSYIREWHPTSYDEPMDFSDVKNKDLCYIVDLSPEGDSLLRLKDLIKRNNRVVWCDHHPASVENDLKIKGYRNSSMSGVALTYLYLNKKKPNEKNFEKLPYEVRMVSDCDTGSFSLKDSIVFVSSMLGEQTCPMFLNNIWRRFLLEEKTYKDFILQGRHIQKYNLINSEKRCRDIGYESTICGIKCFCVNDKKINFGEYRKKYSLCVSWVYIGNGKYQYSLRTNRDDISCRAIAEKFGGGGHEKAAGFVINRKIV